MSAEPSQNKSNAGFLWVLGAFAGFVLVLSLLAAYAGRDVTTDPKMDERLANRDEIAKAQRENLVKLGLDDPAKAAALFAKTATALQSQAAAKSSMLVPGSPTQLKEAAKAAPPPTAAPAAQPAPAPAAPPAPAPAAQPK